ncbi:MAG: hypothetical protein A3J30_03805 [Candidatus Wildermuthbacteria bacterium RIFCSPLOWO2_02_FULL_47_9c]|uniref:Phosphoglycerate kinase n=2 Tax=Parcubacteria group TaxID=1794811 RepID=A0A837IL99_9BACT|nr:MAG: Phosphoglycerate kinase [Candidatus Yanofskybacteria bacterium GW2011_GWC1_48_11]KKW04141.1 MAG: Phosphoglycerate kinase [Parcubacteria group bacterium GW2011_GWB1_49_12]KKW08416.1 MAG: Phosphoglycerate kinase [Parcubacteria group bacterium GW2011_GWA1_49_26]KKW14345.1 MAG: Phosphoglycerate kinase [Parcubacteria group bacterium GW2011_GWA2_50_10]OHA61189.1 MAG: hypothetical protein A2109_01605 [Candidatus Wildermuthbacteria bacterium GWA1_49_26]OHA65514.1 MAG: hypothetical protein A267
MIPTLKDVEIQGRRVLVRASLNVPVENGVIQDDFRLRESTATIRFLTERNAKCVVFGHLGRPAPIWEIHPVIRQGAPSHDGADPKELSLSPIAKRMEELLGKEVKFLADPIGEGVRKRIEAVQFGDVALLENIRFYYGEKENDPVFAKHLAALGDLYVNDAFAVCHRAHASVVGLPPLLPSAMGLLLEKEVSVLGKIRERPEKPMVVVVGGAKVETKAAFLTAISKHADVILLGNLISEEIKEKGLPAGRQGLQVVEDAELVYATDGVDGGFDLGPDTVQRFIGKMKGARTIFWAGPLGKIEEEKYEKGSLAVAEAILKSGAFAVAGGGDLGAFLNKHNLREKFDHVSTGGGAMLAFLAGEKLPGLEALEQ